jgi:hypothetical protein
VKKANILLLVSFSSLSALIQNRIFFKDNNLREGNNLEDLQVGFVYINGRGRTAAEGGNNNGGRSFRQHNKSFIRI